MNNTSFYLITDSHYVSKKTWVEGKPINLREKTDHIALKKSPEILDSFIEKIIADSKIDTVIFTGDNVNNCDMESHIEFRERLNRLKASGKRVFVTYATHDYSGSGDDENFFKACRFTEYGTEPIPFMRKNELFDFYYDYGPAQALSIHRESGSYTVQLGDKTRLIAIIDNGNGRSHCGLFEDGFEWLKGEISDAHTAGDDVIVAVHHPVLPPWNIYRHVAEFELFGGYKELTKIMCENGIRVVFTGHTHVQNIRKYTDKNGRWFLDISTISLVNAAGKMRKVVIDEKTGRCDVTSVGSNAFSYNELYGLNFPGITERLITLALSNYSAFIELADGLLPADKLKRLKPLVKSVCKKAQKIKLSTAAKIGGAWKELNAEERNSAKNEKLIDTIYIILKHIFEGNAPFTPDTIQYKTVNAAAHKADRLVNVFKIKKIKNIIPEDSSLQETVQDFLYNNRTGNDDSISFYLRDKMN